MISVILLGNFGGTSASEILSSMVGQPNVETILIAKTRPAALEANYKFIPTGQSSISSCISIAAGMATGDTVVFVDGRSSVKDGNWEKLLASIDSSTGLTWFDVEADGHEIELDESSPEGMLHALTNDNAIPTACVAIRSSLLPRSEMPEGETSSEILAQLMIQVIGTQETTARGEVIVSAPADSCQLSDKSRAVCLKTLVNASNIEDMFPRHDWNTHEKESAAAAYHSIAALFIRLGETESAMDCLRLSDQLEDSPRSLALKGLIASDRGEILGAVANMVSSLQQYELRKKENEIHYSQFQPTDLEVINENLNAGLQALNKRDNQRALNHFAEAVFNFDPFYSKYGVARLRAA